MAERIESINPTRMELLKLKVKLKLADKGYKLLKEKRDALIMEFFNIIEQARSVRENAEEELAAAYRSLILAEATLGPIKVSEASMAVKQVEELSIESRNIMGVKVPVLEINAAERKVLERGYGIIDTSPQLDDAAKRFEMALKVVINLAEIEKSVRLLSEEIESTKRRVNALENTIIPRLAATVKYVKMRLDEMERENFFKLKRIKAMMEEAA